MDETSIKSWEEESACRIRTGILHRRWNRFSDQNSSPSRRRAYRLKDRPRQHPFSANYKTHDNEKHRQALRLAKATRDSLYLENELAFQRLREAQILLKVLESEARLTEVKMAEAETQVGMARAHLKSRDVCEESDNEFLSTLGSDVTPDNSAGSESDESGSEYLKFAASPEEEHEHGGFHHHSESSSSVQIKFLVLPYPIPHSASLHPMSTTNEDSLEPNTRRSSRNRNSEATVARMNTLSDLVSRPTQSRRKQVSAPTTGERGQALATQKRTRSKRKTTEVPAGAGPSIPDFVPVPYNAMPTIPLDQMQPPHASTASTRLMSQFQVDGGAGVVGFNINSEDFYSHEGETTIRPDAFSNMFQMLDTSPFYPQPELQLNFGEINDTFLSDYDNLTQSDTFQLGTTNFPEAQFIDNHEQSIDHLRGMSSSQALQLSLGLFDDGRDSQMSMLQPQLASTSSLLSLSRPTAEVWATSANISLGHSSGAANVQHDPLLTQWTPDPLPPNSIIHPTGRSQSALFSRHPYLMRDEQQIQGEFGDQPAPTVDDFQVAKQEKDALDATEKVVKLKLLIQHGFPDLAMKRKWGNEAYGEEFVEAKLRRRPDPTFGYDSTKEIYSVVRGALKDLCAKLVPSLYQMFPIGSVEPDIRFTRDRVIELKLDGLYTKASTHLQIIKTFCYKPKIGHALGHDALYGLLFPLSLIALVFSAIHCILDCYKTGIDVMVEFSGTAYGPRYLAIMKDLHSLVCSQNVEVVEKLRTVRQRLFNLRLEDQTTLAEPEIAESFLGPEV
ncbi:hypothetical protein HYPSUDRAFT_57174 [Hypholoma sublateritium FD-334 SS-4]|uniref:DUF6532 domain-containing protein n=1 Tax=Hypholoma sublateritium (strain FD-334 SS-4) TaxID=945553 RepID=A0A0D2PDL5_HYPSF|nr:hypothetical protein HYPSUDRAFT_57174 [Hypholoma sublateritium FD-334 SS-4]